MSYMQWASGGERVEGVGEDVEADELNFYGRGLLAADEVRGRLPQ